MLTIMGRTSSINVRKVLWTAAETGLPFIHEAQWGDSESLQSEAFLQLNPHGLIPVLRHDNGVLRESNTICRYLAGLANRSDLLPDNPAARADVEMWMDWQATELNSAWRGAFTGLVRQDPYFLSQPELIGQSVAQWNRKMLWLESVLAQRDGYLSGNDFTLADIVIGISVQRWLRTPMTRPATPALCEYYDRLMQRPAAQQWIDPSVP